MKKLLVLAAFAAVLAVSCQKNEIPASEQKPAGVPMKLIARIDNTSKVTYEPDGNVLKTNWEASEAISVLTIDGSGNLLAVDNFTSTGVAGRADAVFTGTFTGGETPYKVIAVYPALIYDGSKYYNTDTYADKDGSPWSALYNAQIGNLYIQFKKMELRQSADNDASHLRNFCVMDGVANTSDIKSNILNVTLSNEMTVIKVTATFPASLKGKSLDLVEISGFDSTDAANNWVRSASWEYVDLPGNDGIIGRGGGYNQKINLYGGFKVPESGVAVLYFANHMFKNLVAGDKLKFTATVAGEEQAPATKVLTSNITFDKGKVYRVSVTIPE